MQKSGISFLLFACVWVFCAAPATESLAQEEPPARAHFDIPAQPLNTALIAFSKQAGVPVSAPAELVAGKVSRSLKGELTHEAALAHLLRNTGLELKRTGTRTYLLAQAASGDKTADSAQATRATSTRVTSDRGISGAQGVDSKKNNTGKGTSDGGSESTPLDEIVVTGTHIRGLAPVGAQLVSISRKQIDETGLATVQDVVRLLPQNFGGGPSEDTSLGLEASTNAARSTSLNLRGLGAGATLVLVNGRRFAPAGTEGTFTDISSIPLAVIERIEVLPDGASAIYGSEAVGGVINLVLRTDYEGAETRVRFGSVTSGGLQEVQFAQALGASWGKGHALLSYDYYDRESLAAGERPLASASDLRQFGGSNFDDNFNNPGTITVGAQTWAIPAGQDGRSLGTATLVPGTVNRGNRNELRDLLPEQRRHSVFGTFKHDFSDRASVFSEALFSSRETRADQRGVNRNLTVTRANPFYFNPTGGTGSIRVAYNFGDDLGPSKVNIDVDTYNAAAGGSLTMGADWRARAHVAYAREELLQTQNFLDLAALTAVLADPDPATAFNPFGDGSFTDPATLERLRANTIFTTTSVLRTVNATADGVLLHRSSGDIRLAVGAEHREQDFDSLNQIPVAGFPPTRADFNRTVTAAFAELLVPLVKPDESRPGLHKLALSLAGRYEDYSDFGDTMTPKLGIALSPATGVSVRGSWSKSFKAPNLADLFEGNNNVFVSTTPDPSVPSGNSQVLVWQGKNADLLEETATSWTFGVELAPPGATEFRIALTYFDIEFEDRINAPPFGAFLTDPRFADIVTRNPTAEQRAAVCGRARFLSGTSADCLAAPVVAIVDTRTANTAFTETAGIDLFGTYELQTRGGRLGAAINATYLLDFSEAQRRASPLIELVDTQNNPIDLRVRSRLSWSRGRFEAAAFVNHADSYSDTTAQPAIDIGSWTTMDLTLTYRHPPEGSASLLKGTVIALSTQNVFGEDPPFLNNPVGVGYDPENADLLGRLIGLQVIRSW